jgi:hypothetical protein
VGILVGETEDRGREQLQPFVATGQAVDQSPQPLSRGPDGRIVVRKHRIQASGEKEHRHAQGIEVRGLRWRGTVRGLGKHFDGRIWDSERSERRRSRIGDTLEVDELECPIKCDDDVVGVKVAKHHAECVRHLEQTRQLPRINKR